jgi:hypothetical protein
MDKVEEYRKHAASLLDLATRAAGGKDKGRLLIMSEAWLNLADKVSRSAGRRKAAERLVREVFGENRPKAE